MNTPVNTTDEDAIQALFEPRLDVDPGYDKETVD